MSDASRPEPPDNVQRVTDGIRTRDIQIHNLGEEFSNVLTDNQLRESELAVAHSVPTDNCNIDPNLMLIIEAWPRLSEAVQDAMVNLARKVVARSNPQASVIPSESSKD